MNSYKAINIDTGNYSGIPHEFASEAVIAYAWAIENHLTSPPHWLTVAEVFEELRNQVRSDLKLI